ncbi:MAG: ATP-binding protein [Clostridia bacterium]|nr:ATP-binding protein [Clostridia bacterium]
MLKLLFGNPDQTIPFQVSNGDIRDIVFITVFFLISMFFLLFYVRRPKQKEYLYFGLGVFCLLMYTYSSSPQWRFNLDDPLAWLCASKGYKVFVFFLMPMFLRFYYENSYVRDDTKLKKIYDSISKGLLYYGAILFIIVLTPIPKNIFILLDNINDIVIVLGSIVGNVFLIKKVAEKDRDSIILFIGISAFSVLTFLQVTYKTWQTYMHFTVNYPSFTSYGSMLLIITFTMVIISRFFNSFSMVEALSKDMAARTKELDEKNKLLEKADKTKDDFLANTSHELKTPLHGIIGITEAMLEESDNRLGERQKESLSLIVSSARRLTELINDILDFSKMKNHEIVLGIKTVDVWQITDVAITLLRPLAKEKGISLKNEINENKSYVLADENRIRQIMHNLLGNAIKYTQAGEVAVSAIERDGRFEITVLDTGIGIPEARIHDIFKPFEQLEPSERREHGGAGLGLSITKKLIELHEGEIWVESEVGRGSKFTFTLPKSIDTYEIENVLVPKPAALERLNHKPTNTPDCTPKCSDEKDYIILVADDEPVNLQVLTKMLEIENYSIITANNGAEALEEIKSGKKIDLVILDVMMPRLSGYDVCNRLRESYSLYDLPVLLVTARNQPDDIIAGFEAGANDYLSKPFYSKELRARIRTLLELKKAANYALNAELHFLQAQIKPHFLHNALNTIMSFIRFDPDKARELLLELSTYLRESFNFKNIERVMPLSKEIAIVKSYLFIEMARFSDKLNVVYDIDDVECSVPHLILQPIVENAVRHGVLPKKEGGMVKISIKDGGEHVLLNVEDNGDGIDKEKIPLLLMGKLESEGTGVGLSNVHKRMQAIYGHGVQIESEKGKYTSISISIPKSTVKIST